MPKSRANAGLIRELGRRTLSSVIKISGQYALPSPPVVRFAIVTPTVCYLAAEAPPSPFISPRLVRAKNG